MIVSAPILVLLLQGAGAVTEPATPKALAITHVTVVDTMGGPAQQDVTVVIRNRRIASIEKTGSTSVPKDAQQVDGRGKFLIPGLWDMHVHLSWSTSSALPALVANGVTGVRDMGGRLSEIDEWRMKIAAGLLVGPRIIRAGPMLNGQKFNSYQMVPGNPDETRGVVRALKEVGVDFIKVHRRLPKDSYFAAIDEAKRQGLQLVGHIPMTVTPEEASNAGQATIEHTETLFEGTFSAGLKEGQLPAAIRRFRSEASEKGDPLSLGEGRGQGKKLFAQFVKNGTVVTPTLATWRFTIQSLDPSTPEDPRSRYVALSLRKEAQKGAKSVSPEMLAGMKETFAELREVVRQMNRSRVTLMAGTDTAGPRIPGFGLHDELAILAEVGLTPLQVLQAATLIPARLMKNTSDFGTVETGKIADLVLLDADPLDDIRNTQRISAVVIGGKLLLRADLDELLREAERLASKN
jgi:imidazolonepropionase-like amidohydrolase